MYAASTRIVFSQMHTVAIVNPRKTETVISHCTLTHGQVSMVDRHAHDANSKHRNLSALEY